MKPAGVYAGAGRAEPIYRSLTVCTGALSRARNFSQPVLGILFDLFVFTLGSAGLARLIPALSIAPHLATVRSHYILRARGRDSRSPHAETPPLSDTPCAAQPPHARALNDVSSACRGRAGRHGGSWWPSREATAGAGGTPAAKLLYGLCREHVAGLFIGIFAYSCQKKASAKEEPRNGTTGTPRRTRGK